MALMCYNKGCGEKFDKDKNADDACLFHPGVPIFHDALKGWSCCRKRTTDFSEFLSIKGCTRGRHSNEKPVEALKPEVTSDKGDQKHHNGTEIIYQGPKSAEALQKERPSPDAPKTKLPLKVSASLSQLLEKLEIDRNEETKKKESQAVMYGTKCKNPGCKGMYKGFETNVEECIHHPGGPVFHEGYKYWSCCCIKTMDFNEFLDQKGCTTGRHRWIPRQDKKKVACRHDWHQTGAQVVVTIYAKNSHPEHSYVEANGTVLTCHIQFENDKIFHRDFRLWGVADVGRSYVSLVPSKTEVVLIKADPVSWGKLEDPYYKPEPEPENMADVMLGTGYTDDAGQPIRPDWDIDDDDISDDEWPEDEKLMEENMKRMMGEMGEEGPPELEEAKDTPEIKKK